MWPGELGSAPTVDDSLADLVRNSRDTTNIPREAAQGTLKIVLGHVEEGSYDEHLDIGTPFLPAHLCVADRRGGPDHPLAQKIPITRGDWVFILPAHLATRHDYIVVLMGDSGNASPTFTIQSASAKRGSI